MPARPLFARTPNGYRPPMRPLDRELPWCAGRTVRELLAITGGLAIVAAELYRPGPVDPGNLAVYVLATHGFHLFNMLRPEWVRQSPVPLSSGAFAHSPRSLPSSSSARCVQWLWPLRSTGCGGE